MKSSKKNIFTTGLAITLAAAMMIGGGTFAYLQGQTDDVVNNFQTNKVLVSLAETTGSDYNIIPGTSQAKDPKVTVDNTVDSYVYVEVTDATDGLVTYEIAEGWTLLEGTKNIYYREVAKDAEVKEFSVLKEDSVSYDAALENADMLDAGGNLKADVKLTFKASAVQRVPFNDPVKAYYQADSVVSDVTADKLNEAVANAEEGAVIALQGNVQLDKNVTINKAVTFVGDGDTLISGKPIAVSADVKFDNIAFEKPDNNSKNATIVYGNAGTEELVFENCTFANPQWEAIQVTSNDFKSLVINNCTFKADAVEGAANESYGNTANQAIRFIHVQPSNNPVVNITITNNKFENIANVVDSIVGIYSVDPTSTITVGGNTFSGWGENDFTDGTTGKLSVGWPEVEALKTVSVWEGEQVTYAINGSTK